MNAALHNVHHARIAYFGTIETYPFYGTDLTNVVEQPKAPPANSPAELCRAWLFVAGSYDYVVIAHQPFGIVSPPEIPLARDRNVTRIVNTLNGSLYKISGLPAANALLIAAEAARPHSGRARRA